MMIVCILIPTIVISMLPIVMPYIPHANTINVVLNPDIAMILGYDSAVAGYVYFSYGDIFIEKFITPSQFKELAIGHPLAIHLYIPKRYIAKIENLYRELSEFERKGYFVEEPTVGITLFIYGGKGDEIVCHGAKAIGFLNPKVDVVKYIERGISIVFTSKDLICGKVGLERFIKVYVSDLKKLGLDPSKAYGVLKLMTKEGLRLKVFSSGSCPIYKEVVINKYLYDSRYNPPKGWLNHFDEEDRDYAKKLWYVFATRYSKAYLYNTQFFTKDEALQNVELKLGIGLMPMQNVIHRLAEDLGGYEPTWLPTPLPPLKTIKNMPWLGVALFYNQSDLEGVLLLGGSLASMQFTYSYSGITLFGIPLLSKEYKVVQLNSIYTATSYTNRGYIEVPTTYIYLGDGLAVNLHITKIEDSNGCEYYMVWPDISFVPIYHIHEVDWNLAKQVIMDYNKEPKVLNELLWSAHAELVYSDIVGTSKGVIYKDSSKFSKVSGIAGSLVSIYKPMFDEVVKSILDSLKNSIAKEMIAFTISSLAFEEFSIKASGLSSYVSAVVQVPKDSPYPVNIYEMVCPQILADIYQKAGYTPYAIEYLADVGYVSAPPGAR